MWIKTKRNQVEQRRVQGSEGKGTVISYFAPIGKFVLLQSSSVRMPTPGVAITPITVTDESEAQGGWKSCPLSHM